MKTCSNSKRNSTRLQEETPQRRLLQSNPQLLVESLKSRACWQVVDSDELYVRIHQRCDKRQISGEPVELGNHQLGFLFFASREGLHQLQPVIALSALDFRELIDQRPPPAIQVAHDRFALGGEAQTGFSLPGESPATATAYDRITESAFLFSEEASMNSSRLDIKGGCKFSNDVEACEEHTFFDLDSSSCD